MDELFLPLDIDGDGIAESLQLLNPEGETLIYSDLNNDGIYENLQRFSGYDYLGNPSQVSVEIDTDNNGVYDTGVTQQTDGMGNVVAHIEYNDYDQDGVIDYVKMFEDFNGDGVFDFVATEHSDNTDSLIMQTGEIHIDQTGNQEPDISIFSKVIDTVGDGNPDKVEINIRDAMGKEFCYDMSYDDYMSRLKDDQHIFYPSNFSQLNSINAQFDPSSYNQDTIVGNPVEDMEYWEMQEYSGPCAIYAQKFVLEEALGREIPIEELIGVAEENGWCSDMATSGTTPLNMGKLLEYYGVDHELSFDNDIESIEHALKEGKNVIVSVDSGQIWGYESNNIFTPTTQADHALQVIGFDYSDPSNPMAILNDSGIESGRGEMVPKDTFEKAWKAGDSLMITC